jgi:glyceronephosphate O-acyltransferase
MEVLNDYSVIFLPQHRSYMDFLLVSIICFHKEIQLPAVAAGQDFLGLSFVSNLMRNAGAFFIRRSFGSDQLYWAIFNEYVQQHLINSDRPLEFFIEGTRSRSSKSLPPKYGMLSTCFELFMKGRRINDIYLVPISLSYERLLEEMLYSKELLGIPKPKESVSGLVKARAIMSESYGSIFIDFGKPLSLRDLLNSLTLENRVKNCSLRQMHLTPDFIFELTPQDLILIEQCSFKILLQMLKNQVVQPISLISTCILIEPTKNQQKIINLKTLCLKVKNLKRILINLGVKVYWPSLIVNNNTTTTTTNSNEINTVKNIVLDNIQLHANLFDLVSTDFSGNHPNFGHILLEARNEHLIELDTQSKSSISIYLKEEVENGTSSNVTLKRWLSNTASNYLALCSYRNQLVHLIVRISFVCHSLLVVSDQSKNTLTSSLYKARQIYNYLTVCFNREFIFQPGHFYQLEDFDAAINYLKQTDLIRLLINENDELQLVESNLEQFIFFLRVFQSILFNYSEIYSTILNNIQPLSNDSIIQFDDEKRFISIIQENVFKNMKKQQQQSKSNTVDSEVLSLNLISNCVLSLKQFNIMTVLKVSFWCILQLLP